MAIRNGRFKGAAGDTRKIIHGKAGAFYRIFNSGDGPFTVNNGGTNITLAPTFSLDLGIKGDVTVTSTEPFDGIYQYLHGTIPVRSGRFRFLPPATPAGLPYPHEIINLDGGSRDAFYRIYNSGDEPIEVTFANGSSGKVDVEPDQSFDFPASKNKPVTVQSKGGNNLKPIQGIYDFLERL